MIERNLNQTRREAERAMSRIAMPRIGIVTSYDPANYAAKVRLQPEDVETGWLPVRSPWSGNGWGMFCPPSPGDEAEIQHQEGGKEAAYVALRAFGDRLRPLSVTVGEFWIVHKSGSYFKFHNDGTIEMSGASNINIVAPSVNITGNLNVTGDVIDRYLTGGYTMASFRSTYDIHTHSGIQAGSDHTGVPDEIL